jgi:hypothetical protein
MKDDESMNDEQIESDSHQIHMPSSTAQSKHSNAVSKVNCIICQEFCQLFESLKLLAITTIARIA